MPTYTRARVSQYLHHTHMRVTVYTHTHACDSIYIIQLDVHVTHVYCISVNVAILY